MIADLMSADEGKLAAPVSSCFSEVGQDEQDEQDVSSTYPIASIL
jgi:hypothetical protein